MSPSVSAWALRHSCGKKLLLQSKIGLSTGGVRAQRFADIGERGRQAGAHNTNGAHDEREDQASDKSIFQRRDALIITDEPAKKLSHLESPF
jgi:hypothetical protein